MTTKTNKASAPPEADDVMLKADQLIDALRRTHCSIPAILGEELQLSSQWGGAAITGGGDVGQMHAALAAAKERREAEARMRRAAIEGLLMLEPELSRARAAADAERSQLASAVLNEFNGRWNHACRELAKLTAEAAALSVSLRATVRCPPPYLATIGVVSGQPEVRLSLPLEPPPVALPPSLATVVGELDRLDAVLAVVGGIRAAQQLDSHSYHVALARRTPTEHGGVYRVVAEFVSPVDGLPFQVGELIDHSLIGQGHLQRLTAGKRYVQPVELESAAA